MPPPVHPACQERRCVLAPQLQGRGLRRAGRCWAQPPRPPPPRCLTHPHHPHTHPPPRPHHITPSPPPPLLPTPPAGVAIEFQAGPFVIGLELIGFGYSERGTLYPPELLDPTKAPIVWTPDFVTNDGVNTGTLRRIDAAGNLYMRGKASLTNGIAKVAQLGIEADAWLMIRYRAPVEVVFSLEVGPTITHYDKITLDLK